LLRASPAQWFEIVVASENTAEVMEILARRGQVQFEWRGEPSAADQLERLHEPVARYRALAAQFSDHWPAPAFETQSCLLPVEAAAAAAIQQIERWQDAAKPLVDRLERLRRERVTLQQWEPVLAALCAVDVDLHALARAGPILAGCCVVAPAETAVPELAGVPQVEARFDGRRAVLGVVPAEELSHLCDRIRARGADCLEIPDWFVASAEGCRAALPARSAEIDQGIRDTEVELLALGEAHSVDHAGGVLNRIEWFITTAENIRCEGQYCWITGWTSETDLGDLNQALWDAGIEATVAFLDAPFDAASPSLTHHRPWLRSFEVFTHAVGVPGVTEIDPTSWLAFLVPVIFGFMCGDVGHGLVIIAAGVLLRSRTDLWRLLVLCGIAATGFGFVYGDVFGYHQLVQPLWIKPLEHPIEVLVVPVVAGALVLSAGVVLHMVQSCWRGELASEGVADAAQLLVYWGILLAFLDGRFAWLSAGGMTLCLGNRLRREHRPRVLLIGIGHQAQRIFALLINTLSFVRVGAFALAHSALESAIITVADGIASSVASLGVIVVGNLLIIVLEGLVVSVQTTRLVLFEFFMRFYAGQGRPFRPAAVPPCTGPSEKGR
jgi:V/A-type H+-transporting ATPase subunit I